MPRLTAAEHSHSLGARERVDIHARRTIDTFRKAPGLLVLSLTGCSAPYVITSGESADTLRVLFDQGDAERTLTISHEITGDATIEGVETDVTARSDTHASTVELSVFDANGDSVGSADLDDSESMAISLVTNEGAKAPFEVEFSVRLLRMQGASEIVWVYSEVAMGWSNPREDAVITTVIVEDE